MNKSRKFFGLFGSLILALGVLSLAGCGPEDGKSSPPDANPPKQTEPAPPVTIDKVELQPDSSDEFQRVHRYLPNGSKVSMRIDYRDGSSKEEFYRPDGTVGEVKEFHAVVDKLKSVTKYDQKGKPLSTTMYRVSGVLEAEVEYRADGSQKITMYRIDGKRLHSITESRADGSKSTVYYQKDGTTLWAKAEWPNSREVVVEYFDKNGVHTQTTVKDSNNRDITVFDPSGKALYKQYWDGYWNPNSTYYYYQSYQLESVEEFDSDGTTIKRRLHVERYSNNRVTKIEYFDKGNPVKEQVLNRDGSVKSERTLQDDGSWLDNTNPLQNTMPDPPVDRSKFDEVDYQDPLTNAPNNFL